MNLSGALGANEFVGGVFSTVVGEKRTSLCFIRLPSISRGIKQEEWTLVDLGMPIDGYTTDPSADVLIVYEDQRVAHSRYVIHPDPERFLVNERSLTGYACIFSAHLTGRSIRRRSFPLLITLGPAFPSPTFLSADPKCACALGMSNPTIPSSGIG